MSKVKSSKQAKTSSEIPPSIRIGHDDDDDLSETDDEAGDPVIVVKGKRQRKGGLAHEDYFVRKTVEHDTKQSIVSDFKNKMTIKFIMDTYGISRRSIYKYVKAADKSQAIHESKGRPKIIDDEGCAKLCEFYKNSGFKDATGEVIKIFALKEANRTAETYRLMHDESKEVKKIESISYTTISRILSKGGCFMKKTEHDSTV